MRYTKLRHIAAAGALALIVTTPLAACGDPSVSPRPAQAAGAESPATSSPTPTAATAPATSAPPGNTEPGVARQPARQKPVKTATGKPATTKPGPTSTKPTPTCHDAVRYDLDLKNTELALIKSMCFRTGGVLRLQGIGPGLVTATPGSLVSQNYEGGVVDLRFVRPGTVTVTIPQDEHTYTITVVVVS